jgi:hypothetical protein
MDAELFIVDQTTSRMSERFTDAAFGHLDWFNGCDHFHIKDDDYINGRVRFAFNRLDEPGVFLAL